ncbi:putative pentatricopeptide repeat-containing protein At3g15930 [Tripterygium wilfordii]|uniref:putative pentatricopeptide repeat-containing protein At3g15930 n=1 Tax=Tripterygium wilfordii TaxID=458696 RepID=UPI0018F810A6|nr:putative pentatricopeptide repeat-containing protein At3g15930 [Tripterygium wilfordii]
MEQILSSELRERFATPNCILTSDPRERICSLSLEISTYFHSLFRVCAANVMLKTLKMASLVINQCSSITYGSQEQLCSLVRGWRSVREIKQVRKFETQKLHCVSRQPDIAVYNDIIKGFSSRKEDIQKVMEVYFELLGGGLVPDSYTIPYLLKECTRCRALGEGRQIHAHAVKFALVSNVFVNNTLMRFYTVCGVIHAARKLFDVCSQRDLVSWTTLIQGFAKMGYPKEAVAAFFRMCEDNISADGMTMVVVLSACSQLGDLSLGKKIHGYMVHKISINEDVFLGNALVDMYLKCGDAEYARKVFEGMPIKNVVSWNSMISGLAQQGEFTEALDIFREMQGMDVKPDDVTLVAVLNSCANLGMLELGKWVHAYIDKIHVGRADGIVGNALVDMYAKCGSIDQAFKVFHDMKYRDVYTYTAMIVGLAMHGEAERALSLFSEMPRMGIKPDEVTFVGVLSACSHAGLVEQGRQHFEDMSSIHDLSRHMEHYGCMVDLLGRAGLINEALQFIKEMPIEPDASVWGALLGACKVHSKVELGEIIMKKLMKLEPERDGAYIIMSNIYSYADRWRDSLKWRKVMKQRKMKKTPGCSSIEVDGEVHEFRKGDKSHPKSKQLYELLDEITSQLMNYGDWTHGKAFH